MCIYIPIAIKGKKKRNKNNKYDQNKKIIQKDFKQNCIFK